MKRPYRGVVMVPNNSEQPPFPNDLANGRKQSGSFFVTGLVVSLPEFVSFLNHKIQGS